MLTPRARPHSGRSRSTPARAQQTVDYSFGHRRLRHSKGGVVEQQEILTLQETLQDQVGS